MANAVPQIRPVISTVSTINAQPEGEMDALLLGRTRVSNSRRFPFNNNDSIKLFLLYILNCNKSLEI